MYVHKNKACSLTYNTVKKLKEAVLIVFRNSDHFAIVGLLDNNFVFMFIIFLLGFSKIKEMDFANVMVFLSFHIQMSLMFPR